MSKYPTIPDFTDDLRSLATAARAMKDTVEQLAGHRQSRSVGAPQMYIQEETPTRERQTVFGEGDLWIKPSTRVMSYWNTVEWVALA